MSRYIAQPENRKYGRLTPVRSVGIKGHHHTFIWRCDCGTLKEIPVAMVRGGWIKSCGCLRKDAVSQAVRKAPGHSLQWTKFQSYRYEAKKRGLIFDLSFEVFIKLTAMDCFYGGCKPEEIRKKGCRGAILFNGLDRLDPGNGYTADNVVPCCKQHNWMKKGLSYEHFIEWIKKVYAHSIEGKVR